MKQTCAEGSNLDPSTQNWGSITSPKNPNLSSLHDDQPLKSSTHHDKDDQEQVPATTDDQVPLRRARVTVRARSEAPMVRTYSTLTHPNSQLICMTHTPTHTL